MWVQLVLVSHSWGDNVFRNFLTWVGEQDQGWCEEHIHSYVNIAGPTLGVPKSVSTYLSGAAICQPRGCGTLRTADAYVKQSVPASCRRISRLYRTRLALLSNRIILLSSWTIASVMPPQRQGISWLVI